MRRSTNSVDAYALAIVRKQLPAGRYHRLACERHLRDRAHEGKSWFPFQFEWEAADRFLRFMAALKHYKGEWAGRPIIPSANQVFRLGSVYGWRRQSDGLRRFTTAYNETPRKSGKTLEAAVVALYSTFFEGEPGSEGYCIATKLQQAKLVFRDAKKLVKTSGLSKRLRVNAWNLHREDTESKLEPLGSDYSSTDGLNPHLIITDEFHAMKTRDLLDVMESATGARRNPLHFQITTAGDDPVSPCGDQHDYVTKILEQALDDDESTVSMFACVAHADPEDDWQAEATWRKANPHYDISVKPEDMRKLAAKAKNMPAAAAEFQQKRLNWWVSASQPWLSMDGWRAGQTTWGPDDLLHEACWVGIDLASKLDLCAMVCVFPPTATRASWRLLPWVWTPEETLKDRAHRDRAPYDVWVEQGHLLTSPGTRVDHGIIREILRTLRERYTIERIGFDPWHADKLVSELVTLDGFAEQQVLEVAQTYAGMSAGAQAFEAAVLAGQMDAGGSPLMTWCASNAVVQRDGKDNIYPVKKKSRGRIDPIMAAIIGMSLAQRFGGADPDEASRYFEQYGLLGPGEVTT